MKNILLTLALLISGVSFGQTAKEYYDRGFSKVNLRDFSGAISDYTKEIEINPNSAEAYINRAISKAQLGNKKGACEDVMKVKEMVRLGAFEDKLLLEYKAGEVRKVVCD